MNLIELEKFRGKVWKTFKTQIDLDLRQRIMDATSNELSEMSLPERIFLLLNGGSSRECRYDHQKKFANFSVGYRYCAANCRCQKEDSGSKIKIIKNAMSDENKQSVVEKMRVSMLDKYGADNALRVAGIKEKVHNTIIERYGVENSMQNLDILDKMQSTMIQRHGAKTTFESAELAKKSRATILEKYGVEHALQNPSFMDAYETTMKDRYGGYTLQSPYLSETMRQTMARTYGVEHALQRHISSETMTVLNDSKQFTILLETHSVSEAAKILGISETCIIVYCRKYNILLPSSSYETAIASFLNSNNINFQLHNRTIIKPLEIDILLPDQKIGIEFCGLYWHGENIQPDKNYHLNKLLKMKEAGYRLITIFEDEWLHKRDIAESRLLHLLGKSQKGKGARQLIIKNIASKDAVIFLNAYHIQGAGPHGYARYGAYDGDILVAVMTFSHPRVALGRTTGADELLRFATDGKNYPGVASRLFKAFIRNHQPKQIISYADRRWSDGNLYEQLGFEFEHATQSNYWYVDFTKILREHRFKYRKDQIKHLIENGDQKTEREIMLELGRDRIWDCGSLKFVWSRVP